MISRKANYRIQGLAWACFLVLLLLYSLQKWDDPWFSLAATLIATFFYIVAVYAHLYLLQKFFSKDRRRYILYLGSCFLLMVLLRLYLEYLFLYPIHKQFYNYTVAHVSLSIITIALAFLFGALFYILINYLELLGKQQQLENQQLQTQLQLLKAQVQPHFLFNTLNNIYYLACYKQNDTPDAIAKLSQIMRYFLDTASKERVPLQTEIDFIRSYMQLEQMRIANPIELTLSIDIDGTRLIPPMLLLPFIENIYKHGINKATSTEPCAITVIVKTEANRLYFRTENPLYNDHDGMDNPGTGLSNLERRLSILYKNDFVLNLNRDIVYTALLNIPLDDPHLYHN